jgi:hypothetical protein
MLARTSTGFSAWPKRTLSLTCRNPVGYQSIVSTTQGQKFDGLAFSLPDLMTLIFIVFS